MKGFIAASCIFLAPFLIYGQKLTKFQRDSLKSALGQMEKDDQKYRWQLMLGELDSLKLDSLKKLPRDIMWERIDNAMSYKIGFGKSVSDSLSKLQNILDSLNYLKFVKIINKYGYPSYKRTGSSAGGLLTIHTVGRKEFEDLLPTFQRELYNGNMPAIEFAAWYDRCQLFMNKKQLYGEYDRQYPCMDDLEMTNIERKKIGLKTLKKNKCR